MFVFSDDVSYAMPAHFGGVAGGWRAQTYADVTTLALAYETDGAALARFLPAPFRLAEPLLLVHSVMNRSVGWMAGGHYNLVAVNVPVTYEGPDGRLDGAYALVVWENKASPIIGGREQTGVPKIFADIEDHRRWGDGLSTNASHEGEAFLRLEARIGAALDPGDLAALNVAQAIVNWFGWRYIPNMGRPGAALSHATLYPIESVFDAGWHADGELAWAPPAPARHPTQAHIIQALAGLPLRARRPGHLLHGRQVLRVDIARALG